MIDSKRTIKNIDSLKEYTGFDISKYNDLDSMSDSDIFFLLKKRVNFKSLLSNDFWFLEYSLSDYDISNIGDIPSEKFNEYAAIHVPAIIREIQSFMNAPLSLSSDIKRINDGDSKILSLSHGNGVYPLNRGDILSFLGPKFAIGGIGSGRQIVPSDEDLLEMEENDASYDDYLIESVDLLIERDGFNNKVGHFVIDFSMSDKELIDSFTSQISKWRKELKIEPATPPKNWAYIKSRVLEYNVIPLMDLLACSELFRIKIPSRVLAIALFPNGERDGFGISQTVLPFIESYVNEKYIYECEKQIYQ
ncbi:DUF6387 family protein [Lelliottia sp. SL45]|uniref:DUF6387 family protein n=1 Tax=Lelliottia sp. SL45 TaxID=2994665 RepID=UPI0022726790|nr:DUF6387 family protein [Lelliottia sp. SL45]MCY1696651.1 DUF6387 family protein [Lelliottia sp. SL45]